MSTLHWWGIAKHSWIIVFLQTFSKVWLQFDCGRRNMVHFYRGFQLTFCVPWLHSPSLSTTAFMETQQSAGEVEGLFGVVFYNLMDWVWSGASSPYFSVALTGPCWHLVSTYHWSGCSSLAAPAPLPLLAWSEHAASVSGPPRQLMQWKCPHCQC